MKNLTRASLLSLLLATFITLLAAILLLPWFSVSPRYYFTCVACLWVLSFLLLLFFIEKLIYRRIYLAVHHYRLSQTGTTNGIAPVSANAAELIKEELLNWSEDRRNEIERLRKLELYRKEYLGNVSHELKTPVFNIQGYILTLLDGALEDPKVNRDYLGRAEKSVERMINMIEDLESISQLETGELQLEPEKFDLIMLVKEVFSAEELRAASKGIIFTLKENPDKPVCVFADRSRIRQVLTNLVVNSIKYGKEYGQTRISFYEQGDLVTLEVEDDGIGIAP
jgi:two-component system phosphate regulon sensor histidine kinase PhoR